MGLHERAQRESGEDILRVCFICSASRPHAVATVETHIHREVVVFGVLCWHCLLEGVELHRDRTLPSTDSRALNGLIFGFEGYHYFRQGRA